MTVDEALLGSIRTQAGVAVTRSLGTVTAVLIRRYARAIGESDPLYYDSEYARSRGYADVVAPPNLVTAVSVWDEGDATDDLRADGTPAEIHLHGLPTSGVRVMGGGEDMEFHAPVTAGTTLQERSTLVDAELREGRSGPLIVVRYRDDYLDDDGRVYVTTTRKVLVR
ncbi:FAS1-like dehydratase domain-containing protein [Amycolatopsis jejuensis]|uniref:FAS1-like dehydratase domain-containing protein n=1 Tax=Amycolatopsis jejuensis TaxID=330084 RepID=UPI0005264F69|nr:MaoC family dehydratase N-terminal domain-containing protein [Amycolatopsis jejuensis]